MVRTWVIEECVDTLDQGGVIAYAEWEQIDDSLTRLI